MVYPHYSYPVESLYTGSSLGNYYAFARLDEQTNLKGLWSSIDNQYYVGEWNIDLFINGKLLVPRDTLFYPESQTTIYSADAVTIKKQFFVPYLSEHYSRSEAAELRSGIMIVRIDNQSAKSVEVAIRHRIVFPARKSDQFIKQPLQDQIDKRVEIVQKENRCEILTIGNAKEARIFGSNIRWTICEHDDQGLKSDYQFTIECGRSFEIPFVISFSPYGVNEALESFSKCLTPGILLDQAIENYTEILSRSFIYTPEPVINRGLQWAKINTVRVQHRYNAGEGFTNDPPQDIVVLRDLAWYILGSDYVTPEFSGNILNLAERYGIHLDGKITEYIHANEKTPVRHDYNLNINDDTPLLVFALYHHAITCDDETEIQRSYPLMKRACDYLLSQMKDGLVYCTAEGTNVWGICSWRNIIDGYTLSGAVTEINAECYFALTVTSKTATRLGLSEEANRYNRAAENLRQAINKKLISEKNGMYVLNVDTHGISHHDVTGDLIFPVLFDVPDNGVRKKILDVLAGEGMWTPYGSHTVSKLEKNYDPDSGYQLMGGVWHNLTAWLAYCLRDTRPEKSVEGMINIFRLSEIERPMDFQNVVPGEFPERMHGETFQSRGMAMSPWMPPTYLWLGVEGLLGVKPAMQSLEMNPCIPSDWKWIAVKNLPYKGRSITAFLFEDVLYATMDVESSFKTKIGIQAEVLAEPGEIFSIGMITDEEILIFSSADHDVTGTVKLRHDKVSLDKHIALTKGQAVLTRVPNLLPKTVMDQQ
jgi:glycogen debranching enzyme